MLHGLVTSHGHWSVGIKYAKKYYGVEVKPLRLVIVVFALAGSLTACSFEDLNNQFEDDGEIYWDPNCADEDQDGWCD